MFLDFLKTRREEILEIAKRHGAYNIRIFGSVVRGNERLDSDVDFLIEFEPDRSLVDEVALIDELASFLQRPVDVAEPDALHWYIKDRILSEAIPL